MKLKKKDKKTKYRIIKRIRTILDIQNKCLDSPYIGNKKKEKIERIKKKFIKSQSKLRHVHTSYHHIEDVSALPMSLLNALFDSKTSMCARDVHLLARVRAIKFFFLLIFNIY